MSPACANLLSELGLAVDQVEIVSEQSWSVPIPTGIRTYTLILYRIRGSTGVAKATELFTHAYSGGIPLESQLNRFRAEFQHKQNFERVANAVGGPDPASIGAYHVVSVANALGTDDVVGFEISQEAYGFGTQRIDILARGHIAIECKAKAPLRMATTLDVNKAVVQATRRLIGSDSQPACKSVVVVYPDGLLSKIRNDVKECNQFYQDQITVCCLSELKKIVFALQNK